MNKKCENRQKHETQQIDPEQVGDVKADLVTVEAMEELHHERGAHDHRQNNHDAAHQRG